MQNIEVRRYSDPQTREKWQGWIEPSDRSWILFIDGNGAVHMFDKRDPDTGAIIE